MPAPRRLILSAGFLAAATFPAATTPARGQTPRPPSPGTHVPLGGALTPDQMKQALEQFGAGGLPADLGPLADLFRDLPGGVPKLDPKLRDELLRQLRSNPDLMRRAMEEAKKRKATGQPTPDADELKKLLKDFPFPKQPSDFGPKPQDRPPFGKDTPPVVEPKFNTPPPVPPKDGDPLTPPDNNPGRVPPLENPDAPFAPPVPPFDPNATPRERGLRAAASLWERNVGPLDETPAVKRALLDLVDGTGDLQDGEGNNFWDSLSKETGDATSFADFIKDASLGESWKLPKFDMPSFNWSKSDPDLGRGDRGTRPSGDNWWSRRGASPSSPSRGSSSGSGWNFGSPGSVGSWVPVVLLAVVLLGALVLWRYWYFGGAARSPALTAAGLGAWPVDPRRLTTRRHVVRAFEYLSVLRCGPAAKTWTHHTIAGALSDLAATHGETALMLARLYELARYAPLDEALTTAELAEARRLVCTLAGLGDE